jgi:hypothetical protein
MADSVVYLFLYDFFHQVLFYFGTVGAMAVLIYDKWRDRPIQIRPVMILLGICVFVSSFQAWVDEHRNSEQLKIEKAQISGEVAFWMDQSYQKDASLRVRDSLLAKNVDALTGTQQSLASLSNKVLDISKPEPLKISIGNMIDNLPEREKGYKIVQVMVMPNKVIPAKGWFYCECTMTDIHAWVLGSANLWVGPAGSHGGIVPMPSGHEAQVDIVTPIMGPSSPLIISFSIPDSTSPGLIKFSPQ